jgi:hypothetical protein
LRHLVSGKDLSADASIVFQIRSFRVMERERRSRQPAVNRQSFVPVAVYIVATLKCQFATGQGQDHAETLIHGVRRLVGDPTGATFSSARATP